VIVHPGLIKRQRTHFATFEALGVDMILGLNGLVWVAPHVRRGEDGAALATDGAEVGGWDRGLVEVLSWGGVAGGGVEGSVVFFSPPNKATHVHVANLSRHTPPMRHHPQPPPRDVRERTVRIAAAIRALAALHLQIYPVTILDAYQVRGCRGRLAGLGGLRAPGCAAVWSHSPQSSPPVSTTPPDLQPFVINPLPPPHPHPVTHTPTPTPCHAHPHTHTHTHSLTQQLSLDNKVEPKNMEQPAFLTQLAQNEAVRRHNALAAEAAGF